MNGAIVSRKGEDIAAEVIMMRTASKGPFVIVEGPTDERFIWPRIRQSCYVAIGSGRSTVERAVTMLDAQHAGNSADYVGIVDEDYDWLINYSPVSSNILKTDPRDVEGLLFRSAAVLSVLAEFANRGAVQHFENRESCPVLTAVLMRAEPFGRIRMVNAIGPMVDISDLKPVRFYQPGWSYDIEAAKQLAVALGVAPDVPTLEASMLALSPPDIWHCVRGHDLVDVFVGGLIHELGGTGVNKINVERVLRQAMSASEFATSLLYARLDAWGKKNRIVLN